jgi:hypothetical protein
MVNSIDQLKGIVSSKRGFAAPNIYRVFLPSFAGIGGEEINILCTGVNMPGRQIMTTEKRIGMVFEKVANNQAYDDINMSFHVLNDYGIRKYFEAWQNLALDQEDYTLGYKSDYARTVKIQQLRKGFSLPIYQSPLFRWDFFGGGFLDLDVDINIKSEDIVYECTLIDAFPTTMDLLQLGDGQTDATLQLNIQLSYKNWTGTGGAAIKPENNFLVGLMMAEINKALN